MPDKRFEKRVVRSQGKITDTLATYGRAVFTYRDLSDALASHRDDWRLGSISLRNFIHFLEEQQIISILKLEFPSRSYQRYALASATDLDVIQSVSDQGYFSHFTAVVLNGLSQQIPKSIYFNVEQRRSAGGGELTQDRIKQAFSRMPRTTSNFINFNRKRIYLLEGANTGSLGVVATSLPDQARPVRITNLERTLIDAAVRPGYCGGVSEVASAYAAAKDRASANKIASYLKRIGYTYPYHQAVGFYMEIAGYAPVQLDLMHSSFERHFDFYLDYSMKETSYSSRWRIFYPKHLKGVTQSNDVVKVKVKVP